ncbi:hypothetical protein [Kitasatospora sp. NPDC092286]
MPTYRMLLNVYTEATSPSEAAAEFLDGTEDAAVSFDIVETVEAEDTP